MKQTFTKPLLIMVAILAATQETAYGMFRTCLGTGGHTIRIADNSGDITVTIKGRSHSPITSPTRPHRHSTGGRSSSLPLSSPTEASPSRGRTAGRRFSTYQHRPSPITSPRKALHSVPEGAAHRERSRKVAFSDSSAEITSPGSSPSHFPSPTTAAYRAARRSDSSVVSALKQGEWSSSPRNRVVALNPYQTSKSKRPGKPPRRKAATDAARRVIKQSTDDLHLSDFSSDVTPEPSPYLIGQPTHEAAAAARYNAPREDLIREADDKRATRQTKAVEIRNALRKTTDLNSLETCLKELVAHDQQTLRREAGTPAAENAQANLTILQRSLSQIETSKAAGFRHRDLFTEVKKQLLAEYLTQLR